MKRLLLFVIVFYRKWISPLKPPVCRFYPSCSEYSAEVIRRFGALRGSFLALKRVIKCHPLHPGGVDFPPGNEEIARVEKLQGGYRSE